MFASRAIGTTPGGHRYTSAAKFKSTRQIHHEDTDLRRISELEDDVAHPKGSLACAFVSSLFCPILGCIALYYSICSIRAYNQGFYAEATTFYKQAIRWSLTTFIIGLVLGSIIVFCFFVKAVGSI